MFSRDQILLNRNRIRNSMKVCLVTPKLQIHHSELMPQEKESPLQIRINKRQNQKKSRKKSEDLSVFENPNKVKELYISQNFFDLFQILEKLGQGAQSIVKKCRQKATGLQFAVKLFRKSDKELIQNLKRQYKILKTLDHPSIIHANYLFINQKSQNCQLIMQYCGLSDLRTILQRDQKFKEYKASQILTNILLAVSYMHEKGISHRDLKPQNILYDQVSNQIKIIDFQIAKIYKNKFDRIQMWTKTGTLHYQAPQMFIGKYNELVDIWAIGVMAYQMIVGTLPFNKLYTKQTIQVISNNQPDYPSELSNFAKHFIKKCLTKNPLMRCNAKQALSSPFLLQYDSRSSAKSNSSNTKAQRLNRSFDEIPNEEQLECQQKTNTHFKLKIRKCFNEQQLNGQKLMNSDIGIRCYTQQH